MRDLQISIQTISNPVQDLHRMLRSIGAADLYVKFGPFRYTNEAGASSASVFHATSAKAVDGQGIAKTFCFIKRHKDGSLYDAPNCDKSPLTKRKHALAIS